jgi:hypothetical protein
MADCEKLPACPFFHDQLPDMPEIADRLKAAYCRGDNSECARYMVASTIGPSHVPANLFPRHVFRAQKIIARVRTSQTEQAR